jgi:hypothetical protein
VIQGLKRRLIHAWNAFTTSDDPNTRMHMHSGASYSMRPDRSRLRFSNERSIISSIYTRLAIDAASVDIRHVRLDENGRYLQDMDSGLNTCLTIEANLDQAPRQFRQDVFMTMMDKACAAIVPVDTTLDPTKSTGFDIKTLRVAEVIGWHPRHVRLMLYNDQPDKGTREQVILEKKFVGIVENPLSAVMNEPNSTLQRLIRTLNHLDAVDEQSASGRLDILIQLPYVTKSETRREAAQQRIVDLEFQLKGSKYGIGYIDGTEKVIQLNRPAENNLLKQVEYLTNMLYAQLGLTPEVMNGTANEAAMLNYFHRTIEPLVGAVVEAMRRSFLTKTAIAQKQWILPFRDPFRLVPLKDLAEIADKFRRGEIATPNDFRQAIGWKPLNVPSADDPRNTNMPGPSDPNPTQN